MAFQTSYAFEGKCILSWQNIFSRIDLFGSEIITSCWNPKAQHPALHMYMCVPSKMVITQLQCGYFALEVWMENCNVNLIFLANVTTLVYISLTYNELLGLPALLVVEMSYMTSYTPFEVNTVFQKGVIKIKYIPICNYMQCNTYASA
jgi:hypothetical protein